MSTPLDQLLLRLDRPRLLSAVLEGGLDGRTEVIQLADDDLLSLLTYALAWLRFDLRAKELVHEMDAREALRAEGTTPKGVVPVRQRVSEVRPAVFLESVDQEAARFAEAYPEAFRDPPPACSLCDQPALLGSGLCLDHERAGAEDALAEPARPEGSCTCQGFYQPVTCPVHGSRR